MKILYLGWSAGAILACILALPGVATAQRGANQEDRAEITPQDKVLNKKKKGQDPRALGLLQLTPNGKATLIPIAILINGKFYDAGSYKASPVPMALEYGTIYEGEHTGSSLGLFTVSSAMHSREPIASIPWLGTGKWMAAGTEDKKATHKAEDVPVGLVTSDEPPRLTTSTKSPKEATADSAPASAGPPASDSQTSGKADPAPSSSGKPADTSQSKPQTDPSQTKSQPTPESRPDASKKNTPSKSDEAAPAPGEDTNSQAGDANRPKLRRGKPTAPLPADEEVPGYSKVSDAKAAASPVTVEAKPSSSPDSPVPSGAASTPPQLVPAISDAGGPDPRSFVFEWSKGEEDDRRKQIVALAQQQLHAYLLDRIKNSIAPKTTPTKVAPAKAAVAARAPSPKIPDLVLENLQIRTFDLWTNNQPVIVLTATAHPSLPAVGTPDSARDAPEYSIALVARTDIYNNLHKLYAGITDKYHLDVTPRLELIDAVDADGDGRGELLFRQTSDAGTGYIIYRATGDTLWKMFDSLSPQS